MTLRSQDVILSSIYTASGNACNWILDGVKVPRKVSHHVSCPFISSCQGSWSRT